MRERFTIRLTGAIGASKSFGTMTIAKTFFKRLVLPAERTGWQVHAYCFDGQSF
jgi:hypothetical protein